MSTQVQEVQFEEATGQNGILCSSTSFSDQTSALVVGSASLAAKVYEMHQIRWKVCKRYGTNQDESQDAFESELVLGVDHCFMCSRTKVKLENRHCM